MGKDGKVYLEYKSNTVIFLSSFLHAVILFSILSILYITITSHMEEEAFKREINKNLDDNLKQALVDNDKDGNLKKALKNMPLDRLSNLYSNPDSDISIYNSWLKNFMIFCIVAGFVLLIVCYCILYYSCNRKLPLSHILIENVIIFTCIGLFEAYFFFNIAYKYVPVPPSFLINTIYSKLKKW